MCPIKWIDMAKGYVYKKKEKICSFSNNHEEIVVFQIWYTVLGGLIKFWLAVCPEIWPKKQKTLRQKWK